MLTAEDKAGRAYWDRIWEQKEHPQFSPDNRHIRYYADAALAKVIHSAFEGLPARPKVIEAGCADSSVLPYIAHEYGAHIAGVDYSSLGCDRFRQRIASLRLEADIECCDIFEPPSRMEGAYDATVSFGLIEHFTDTVGCVRALRHFLRVGGKMLTVIPNMNGAVGVVQKFVAPTVYGVHVPLTPSQLTRIHQDAGLRVVESNYMLPIGFGVINFLEPNVSKIGYWGRRLAISVLVRASWLAWYLERLGFRLPTGSALSPYCYCIAERIE